MITAEQIKIDEAEKLGFRLAGFRQWPLDKALAALAEMGYHSVELCLEHPELEPEKLNATTAAKLRSLLETVGLRVSSLSLHGRQDDVFKSLRKQKRGLELAGELGTRVLVIGTPTVAMDPEGSNTYRALDELVHVADGTGVMVAVEPEPDTVIHGMYEFSLLASHLSGSALGLNLHLAHAYLTEGSATGVVDEWAPFIVHVVFEDVRKTEHIHVLPGDGHVDLVRSVQHLRDNGYSGDLTMDLPDIPEEPQELARKVMQRCRELLK